MLRNPISGWFFFFLILILWVWVLTKNFLFEVIQNPNLVYKYLEQLLKPTLRWLKIPV